MPNLKTVVDCGQNPEAIIKSISGSTWQKQKRLNINELVKCVKQPIVNSAGHGDVEHGDKHGDHTDGGQQ